MLIPYQSINSETLSNLIESFVLREGTDYGESEVSLENKTQKVLEQVQNGDVVILYSEHTESITLISKAQFEADIQQ